MKRRQNYASSQIQTKRNPRNKKNHDLAVGHAVRLQNKADYYNFIAKHKNMSRSIRVTRNRSKTKSSPCYKSYKG